MDTFIEIANSIIELFIVIFFFNQVFQKRQLSPMICYGTMCGILCIHIFRSFLYLNTYINIGLTMVLWFVLSIILYNDSVTKKLLILGVYIFVILINDIVARFIASISLGINYTLSSTTSIQRYMVMIISDCSCFVMLAYIAMIARNKSSSISLKYWIMMLLFPIFSLFIVVCVDILLIKVQTENIKYICLLLIIIVGLLYFNIVVFEFIDTYSAKLQLNIMRDLIKKQSDNYYLLERSEKELRYLKHNIKKHMSVMQTMLNDNMVSEPTKFMDSLKELADIPTQIIYTKDLTLDSILNAEGRKAREVGIEYIVKTHKLQHSLNITPADKSTILCNAIDNAIEACAFVEKKFIIIDIAADKHKITMCIENSSPPIRLSNGSVITTKSASANHGLGIMSIKYALKNYNGKFNLTYNNGVAKSIILLDNTEL